MWQPGAEISHRRLGETDLWSEAPFKGFSNPNNTVCNIWRVKTGWILFHKLKRLMVSLLCAVQCGLITVVLILNLLFKLIYTVHASLHLSTLCCIKSERIWVAQRTQMRANCWSAAKEVRVMLCHCLLVSRGADFGSVSILRLNCESFTRSRYDQPVLISRWITVSALHQAAAETLFVIYCANQLNWKSDNCTLRHSRMLWIPTLVEL